MEPGRRKGEMNSAIRGRGSGLRYGPFGTSESSTILIGTAGAPMGNWPVTSEVCSSIALVTSGAVTVIPTVPGAVPLFIDSTCHFWSRNCSTNSTLSNVP